MKTLTAILTLIVAASAVRAQPERQWSGADLALARKQIQALGELRTPPTIRDASGRAVEINPGSLQSIYFDALDYEDAPTRVFALIEVPEGATEENRAPGIVLVHGGGGSAFEDWVAQWVARGYAAISIAVEGQTNERIVHPDGKKRWKRHQWAGPRRIGIYGDMSKPIEDQWMYHAVADTVLANSLLRSLPRVDPETIGVMGISWGGVITSSVIGIDARFAFAIPVYGCGHKFDSDNQYGRALGESAFYKEVWDPMVWLNRASMPTQWISWPGDKHFPMDALAASYRVTSGPRLVTLIPGLGHGHRPGWRTPDSYAFAESIVREAEVWARQIGAETSGRRFTARFESTKPFDDAVLVSTVDTGFTGLRTWTQEPADLEFVDHEWRVTAILPDSCVAWFVNLKSGPLTVSSDFMEREGLAK